VCRDLRTDNANCGTCGTACTGLTSCQSGSCQLVCATGQTNCSGVCRDLRTDNANCGTCGTVCPGGQVCNNGACMVVCTGGLTLCSGACVDPLTSTSHCGGCGRACSGGQFCIAGSCVTTIRNSLPWTNTQVTGGCAYQDVHRYTWANYGNMTWRECARLASRYGAMMAPGHYTVPTTGWYGHRNGSQAMTGVWSTYQTANIDAPQACVLGRDVRSTRRDATLASTTTYDGQVWRFQDYGPRYYDECMLLASDAGASMITPYTIGRTGADYWVHSVIACNVYNWITAGGTNFAYDNVGVAVRSSVRNCMVGYVDN
jgi:hypothetical protein